MQRGVDGDSLMVVGGSPGADGSGVRSILPEERPYPGPVSLGESPGITAEELVNPVLVLPGTGRGAVLYSAPRPNQESDEEDRESQAAQTNRWCFSSWARSSRFSRRLLGESSAKAQRTIPSGPIST